MSEANDKLRDAIGKLTWHREWARASNNIEWNLYRLREHKGWTQEELARRMGVAQPVVARHANGYMPSLDSLAKYAHAFGVTIADIVGEPIHPDPQRILNNEGEVVGYYSTKSNAQTIITTASFAV